MTTENQYDINIETHDLISASLNIENISDQLFLGPQAEVLEHLENINERWGTNIGLNKKFGMKPGGYDQIKELLIDNAYKFNMKNSGIERLFSRIENYSYIYSHIQREFRKLQTRIDTAKASNITWTDNTDEGNNSLNFIKEKLSIDSMNAFDHIDIESATLNKVQINDNPCYKDYFIEINLTLNKEYMDICRDNGTIITQVPMSPVNMTIRINLLKLLNQYAVNKYREDSSIINVPYVGYGGAGYHNRMPESGVDPTYQSLIVIRSKYDQVDNRIKHPFLSSRRDTEEYRGQCFGDLHSNILDNVWKLNMPMLAINLIDWSSKYIINTTHPLNNWTLMFHGWPGSMNEEIEKINGKIHTSDCNKNTNWRDDETIDYCNTSECQLRDVCRSYLIETTGIAMNTKCQALLGEILEMTGHNENHYGYYSNVNIESTVEQLITQHDNVTRLMKDNTFKDLISELSEALNENVESLSFTYMRWGDWDELRYACEEQGIDIYEIETRYQDTDESKERVIARLAALGGGIPINIPQSNTESVEVNRVEINDDIPF